MKILITGSKGFIGKNLAYSLKSSTHEILTFNSSDSFELLEDLCIKSDIIVHLAGVNRTLSKDDFFTGNADLTKKITDILIKNNKSTPIIYTSSTQSELDNDYGNSKKLAENTIIDYHKKTTAAIYIFKLTNVFGKWGKPFYNSVVSTWCHSISRNLEIKVDNPNNLIRLVYIDDVVKSFIDIIEGKINVIDSHYYSISPEFTISLEHLKDILYSFKNSRNDLSVFDTSNRLHKYLYSTYLSYVPKDDFSYQLSPNVDNRGSFTEILKSSKFGQISINVCKPNIKKGEHWHNTKVEKFIVVSGKGIIRFRSVLEDEVIEYPVEGSNLEVVDIPPGYTHNIENIGNEDLVTLMWVNEEFDPSNPDTIYEVV